MKINKIDILYNGYSYLQENNDNIMVANCTCTLIRCIDNRRPVAKTIHLKKENNDENIIVDTMTPWDSDRIKQALASDPIQLTPDQIHMVINTHGHSDHIGCNHLFLKADRHIVGRHISQFDKYFLHDFDKTPTYKLPNNKDIDIVATPGHTLNCVSVIVRHAMMMNVVERTTNNDEYSGGPDGTGTVAICGDLFENKDDVYNDRIWVNAGSECQRLQKLNRYKMAQLADWIIPGHGPPFQVTEAIRNRLLSDMLDYFH